MWAWIKKWIPWLLAGCATCGLGFLLWKRPGGAGYVPLGRQGEELARSEKAARRLREAEETAAANTAARERENEHEIKKADGDPAHLARLADGIADEHRRRRGG